MTKTMAIEPISASPTLEPALEKSCKMYDPIGSTIDMAPRK